MGFCNIPKQPHLEGFMYNSTMWLQGQVGHFSLVGKHLLEANQFSLWQWFKEGFLKRITENFPTCQTGSCKRTPRARMKRPLKKKVEAIRHHHWGCGSRTGLAWIPSWDHVMISSNSSSVPYPPAQQVYFLGSSFTNSRSHEERRNMNHKYNIVLHVARLRSDRGREESRGDIYIYTREGNEGVG